MTKKLMWHRFYVVARVTGPDEGRKLYDHLWLSHGVAAPPRERKRLTHMWVDGPVLRMVWEYMARGSNATDITRILENRAEEVGVRVVDRDATTIASEWVGFGGHVIQLTERVGLHGGGRDLDCWACDLVRKSAKEKVPVRLTAKLGEKTVIDRQVTECPLHGTNWLGDTG